MVDIVLKLLHRLNESGLSRASPFKRVLPTLVCGNFSPSFATNSAHLMLVFSLSHRRNQWKVFRWQPRFLFLPRMVLKCYVDWNARCRPRPPWITSRFAHNQERTTTPCSCGPQDCKMPPTCDIHNFRDINEYIKYLILSHGQWLSDWKVLQTP